MGGIARGLRPRERAPHARRPTLDALAIALVDGDRRLFAASHEHLADAATVGRFDREAEAVDLDLVAR
jgi:hypothetical protein